MDPQRLEAHGAYIDQEAMDAIRAEMEAYDGMRDEMEAKHFGKWVIVYQRKLVGIYATLDEAVDAGIAEIGQGHYHIREVGDERVRQLPPALAFGLL